MDCIIKNHNMGKANYNLVGFTMGYGQPNPSTYYYLVDDRLKISDVKKDILSWFSWMKVLKVTKIPFDNDKIKPYKTRHGIEIIVDDNKYFVWGYYTRKE